MIRTILRNRCLLLTIFVAAIALFAFSGVSGNELFTEDTPSKNRPACKQGSSYFLDFYDRHGSNSVYPSSDDHHGGRFNNAEQEIYLTLKARPASYQTKMSQEPCGAKHVNAAISSAAAASENTTGTTYISLTNVKTMDLRWLSRNSPAEYKTEVFFGYRFLPFGEILLGKGVKLQRSPNAFFEAGDDGWRVKFRVLF